MSPARTPDGGPDAVESVSHLVEWFTDLAAASVGLPVGEPEHVETPDGSVRVVVYRGATPVEAMNAYVEDLPALLRAGWRVVATAMGHNVIKYVGLLVTGSSPQYVGQVTLMVTLERELPRPPRDPSAPV